MVRYENKATLPLLYTIFSLTFFIHLDSPPPYDLQSEFEIGLPGTSKSITKSNVFSFGIGRDKMSNKIYAPGQAVCEDPMKPGPGQYEIDANDRLGTAAKKYRMQGRSKNL